jgi:cholesterol transport system auxiliary component
MKKIPFPVFIGYRYCYCALLCSILMTGCATKPASPSLYDFGLLGVAPVNPGMRPISIAEINTSAWLDSSMMFYRLAYANDRQPRSYANSRWTMSPAQLFGQRLKSRIAQVGGVVLSASDGALNLPILRLEADDLIQVFDSPTQSFSQVTIRATVFNGRVLLAQKRFTRQVSAPSADAAGGAQALAGASDAIIMDMMMWLAEPEVK